MTRFAWLRRAFPRLRDGFPADARSSGIPGGSAHEPPAASPGPVRGERTTPLGTGARSVQSRMSSLLAAGLMTSVGAGMLAWYYADALSHPAPVHGRIRPPAPEAPGEGMTLPSFGRRTLQPSGRPVPLASGLRAVPAAAVLQPQPAPSAPTLPEASPLAPPLARTPGELPPGYRASAQLSPRRQALDRRLSGEVFALALQGGPYGIAPGDAGAGPAAALPGNLAQARRRSNGSRGDALGKLLRPAVLAATRAQLSPSLHLLLPQGTFIDCTLETAIDSTLPGMTTCITATDTFSADGTVVLLERGTKLIGETRGEVRQGQARVFVVWTEARTPAGVVVRLDSPGTDALGRSGLEGTVNRHFWQRFGAAALVSTIDGAVQSEVQSSSRSGTVILDPTASEDVLTGILRSTVSIPPTVRVRNGARIQVLVARDVDFRSVYELDAR
jgi:type IV secretion system protein VirB10